MNYALPDLIILDIGLPDVSGLDLLRAIRKQEERFEISFQSQPLTLTLYEFRLLKLLIERPGYVYSREQLLDLAWNDPDLPANRRDFRSIMKLTKGTPNVATPRKNRISHRLSRTKKHRADHNYHPCRGGADVAINDLTSKEEEARELVNQVEEIGRRAILTLGDVTLKRECDRIVKETIEQLGHLDIMVNNAGGGGRRLISLMSPKSTTTINWRLI